MCGLTIFDCLSIQYMDAANEGAEEADKDEHMLQIAQVASECTEESAITRLRTRSAAVRHWRDLILGAYERDLVTNEKVQFRSLDPNRTFEDAFFLPRVHQTT